MGVVTKTKSLIKSTFPSGVAIYAKLMTPYRVRRQRVDQLLYPAFVFVIAPPGQRGL